MVGWRSPSGTSAAWTRCPSASGRKSRANRSGPWSCSPRPSAASTSRTSRSPSAFRSSTRPRPAWKSRVAGRPAERGYRLLAGFLNASSSVRSRAAPWWAWARPTSLVIACSGPAGVDPRAIVACDRRGTLHKGRHDIEAVQDRFVDGVAGLPRDQGRRRGGRHRRGPPGCRCLHRLRRLGPRRHPAGVGPAMAPNVVVLRPR